jgi:redox-sensitive bicupin YhaK (pirin superfamily)
VALRNPTLYLDVAVTAGQGASLPVPSDYQGFAYVLSGQGQFGSPAVPAVAHQRLVLGPGETLRVAADGSGAALLRFVLITGRPIYARQR